MNLKKYNELAEIIIDKSQKKGAHETEVYIIGSKSLSVEVSQAEIETLKNAETYGIGIRVIKDKKMGFAFSSDFSNTEIENAIEFAVKNALQASSDEANGLATIIENNYPVLDLYDLNIVNSSVEYKIKIAKEIDRYAKKFDKRIKVTESCTYQDMIYNVILRNSNGLGGSYEGTYCGLHSFVVAEENNDNQTGFAIQYDLDLNNLDPKVVGEESALKAVRMFGAAPVKSQKTEIVLDSFVAPNFLSVLASSLSAESVQKGKSMFQNKIGEKIAASNVTIVDDGKMKDGILSAPFDGEGVSTKTTSVVENGKLLNYLHNTYTANKEGTLSTGNASRGTYKSLPDIGTNNFYIKNGAISRCDLFRSVDNGFYVTEVMGMHTANPITGDFSVGASGIWIEKGELTTPVRGVTIAGNIVELLNSIDAVANDLTFYVGTGSPSLKISSVTVSGS